MGLFKSKRAARPERKPVTPEAVRWAYRLLLDREAEGDGVVQDKADRLADLGELRQEFLGSTEFKQSNPAVSFPVLSGTEPPMPIDLRLSERELAALFDHVQRTWQHLGDTEPFYSVLTAERYERANIDENLAQFHATGQRDVERFRKTLARNGIDPAAHRSCVEFGCGVGRVTRWLADQYERYWAYDISGSHLQLAQGYLESQSVSRVELKHVSRVEQLRQLPAVDVVYSVIVLQHNPPPIIATMIAAFVDALLPGGVAYFQLPTYRMGYEFSLKRYLKQRSAEPGMEMHVLPQKQVFEIVDDRGGLVLEVLEDDWTRARHIEVSNAFLVQKRRP